MPQRDIDMTNTYEFGESYGMKDYRGLSCVCSTPNQVVSVLLGGGNFDSKKVCDLFNKEHPKVYVDSSDSFENIKADILKKYNDGFEHWKKWCEFLDGEI